MGADLAQLCVHPSRKEDNGQGHHANVLCNLCILKLEPESITPEEHSRKEKEQKGRNAIPRTHFPDDDTRKYDNRCE